LFGTKITCLLRRGTIDFNVIQATTVDDNYNLKGVSFNDGDVVLDLGAYMGGVSLLLASINKNLTVYAYEPLPENIELLNRNIKWNGFSNVFTHQRAISHKRGKMKIYYSDAATESGRVHHFTGGPTPSGSTPSYVEVDATTLEEIFSEHDIERCKLIKMNIEGNELNILKDCPCDVLKRIDYIVGQHHDVTRKELLLCTRGLFEDIPNKFNTDIKLGVFWFKNVQAKTV